MLTDSTSYCHVWNQPAIGSLPQSANQQTQASDIDLFNDLIHTFLKYLWFEHVFTLKKMLTFANGFYIGNTALQYSSMGFWENPAADWRLYRPKEPSEYGLSVPC